MLANIMYNGLGKLLDCKLTTSGLQTNISGLQTNISGLQANNL